MDDIDSFITVPLPMFLFPLSLIFASFPLPLHFLLSTSHPLPPSPTPSHTPSTPPTPPGLLVKSKKRKKEKINKFDYVWASFCSMRQEIDWTKFVLSTSIPKTDSDYICLHDIRKNQNLNLYRSLLESSNVRALVLINSFNSYKVPHELRTQTNMSVLVVTKSTGEALTGILKDNPEARVEFGGHDKQVEWLPAVEPAKLEWESSGITRYMYKWKWIKTYTCTQKYFILVECYALLASRSAHAKLEALHVCI